MIERCEEFTELSHRFRKIIHDDMVEDGAFRHMQMMDFLSPMDFDPDRPAHRLETVHLAPNPLTPDTLPDIQKKIGAVSLGLYDHIVDTVNNGPVPEGLAKTADEEHASEDVFFLYTHALLFDILAPVVAQIPMLDKDHWQDQNGLVISHGINAFKVLDLIKYLETGDIAYKPAIDEILDGTHLFINLPRTYSIEKLGLSDAVVSRKNDAMRQSLVEWRQTAPISESTGKRVGRRGHIAATGTTGEVEFDEAENRITGIVTGEVYGGLVSVLAGASVIPVAILEHDENPLYSVGTPTRVENYDDLVRVQNWQNREMEKHLDLPEGKVRPRAEVA